MDWQPSGAVEVAGAQLAKAYHVEHLTNCSACHR
jgi:mono/diheme cytochrome c family protein